MRNHIKGLVLYLLNGNVQFSEGKKFIDGKYDGDKIGRLIFGENEWRCINKIKNVEINGFDLY